jgi:nitrous oxidase accessory protein NosD
MSAESQPRIETRTVTAVSILVLVVGLVAGLFIVDLGSATPEPVDFDETVSVGLTLEDELRLDNSDADIELPKVQTFYSQYPYVVGYYGVESFAAEQRQPAHEQRFGFPNAIYVTDYAGRDVELTETGLPVTGNSTAERTATGGHNHGGTAGGSGNWVLAEEAVYVVDSEARTPSGETVMPFGDREAAEAFVESYGGEIVGWEAVLEVPAGDDDAEAVRGRIADRHAEANATVDSRTRLRDRPVETVVGEDEPTVQSAIEAAPPNTTVLVPEGTYREHVDVDKPLTLRADGDARIVGNDNGTVVTITANRTAFVGLNVSGVGGSTPGPTVTDGHSTGNVGGASHDHGDTVGDDSWDADVEDDYAQGDTAIEVTNAEDVLVDETEIHTDAAGIILSASPGSVVRGTPVVGSENYREGHMGIVAMRSPGVIENSTFVGGLDGVYTHRSEGIAVRGNEMIDNRMGIHLMFTSGALLTDNAMSGQETAGIYVMTGPQRNAIVGNEIRDTETAISVGGTDSYVAENVVTENDLGVRIEATASIVERNVVADNRNGIEAWALLPTNRVTHNDFVDNRRHVSVSSGRLRVWTHDGEGNYWEGAIGPTDGTVIQRPYTPTAPVDGRLHQVDGAATLARAPALDALAGFQGAVPGMRADEVIDVAPLCAPVNDEWFEATERTDTEPICRSGGGSAAETRYDD